MSFIKKKLKVVLLGLGKNQKEQSPEIWEPTYDHRVTADGYMVGKIGLKNKNLYSKINKKAVV